MMTHPIKRRSISRVIPKISSPTLSDILVRKRTYALLDERQDRPITWISAPPGSGCTTLAAGYLADRKLPCLWYQMDEGDGDVSTFFSAIGLAAKKATPYLKKPLPRLTPEYSRAISSFALRFFEELFNRLLSCAPVKKNDSAQKWKSRTNYDHSKGISPVQKESPVISPVYTVVIDNYEKVPASSKLHEVLKCVFSAIPAGIRVMVISHNEPPPQFAALQVKKMMHFLGWDDICLDMQETQALFEMRVVSTPLVQPGKDAPFALPLPVGASYEGHEQKSTRDKIVRYLYETTEGWFAGLTLLMESVAIQNSTDGKPVQADLSRVFDYLASELFDKLDEKTQSFLLKMTVLPYITVPVAETLTGERHSGKILSHLCRNNCFVLRVSQAGPVYRLHRLFRDFLLSRVESAYTPDEMVEMRKVSAGFMEASGLVEGAAALYFEMEDWPCLIQLILKHAQTFIAQERHSTLEKLILLIPENLRRGNPWFSYWTGVCHSPCNLEDAHTSIDLAFTQFERDGNVQRMLLAWTSATDVLLTVPVDTKYFDEWISRADRFMKQRPDFPSTDMELHVTCNLLLLNACRQPAHAGAHELNMPAEAEKAYTLFMDSSDVGARLKIGAHLSCYYYRLGEIAMSGRIIGDA